MEAIQAKKNIAFKLFHTANQFAKIKTSLGSLFKQGNFGKIHFLSKSESVGKKFMFFFVSYSNYKMKYFKLFHRASWFAKGSSLSMQAI